MHIPAIQKDFASIFPATDKRERERERERERDRDRERDAAVVITDFSLMIIFGWILRGLSSGFLSLWLAVLVFKAMSRLHCFIIVF